jgi:hypothetical protein
VRVLVNHKHGEREREIDRERVSEGDVSYSIRAEEREKQGSSEKQFHSVGKYHYFVLKFQTFARSSFPYEQYDN